MDDPSAAQHTLSATGSAWVLLWPGGAVLTFLQLDLPAVRGPQPVLPLLLPGGRVLVLGRRPGDDGRLFDPELVNLDRKRVRVRLLLRF